MAESTERDTDTEPQIFNVYQGMNIHQRLNCARAEVNAIKKTEGKAGMKYDFIAHDDVTAEVKPVLLRWGINPWPTVLSCSQDGNRTEMIVSIDFINIDKPSEFLTTESAGYGVDNQDKGPGKAYTYAVKGAYLKTMLLNSGDDVEFSDIDHDPVTPRQSQVTKAEGKATGAQIAFAQSYKQSIDSTQSLEALEVLEKENRAALKEMPEATQKYFKDQIAETKTQMEES